MESISVHEALITGLTSLRRASAVGAMHLGRVCLSVSENDRRQFWKWDRFLCIIWGHSGQARADNTNFPVKKSRLGYLIRTKLKFAKMIVAQSHRGSVRAQWWNEMFCRDHLVI